jgi:hypothetical protein
MSEVWEIKDGELLTPEVLERPLRLHTHQWGTVYQQHLTNPDSHKIQDQLKTAFGQHYFEYAHLQVLDTMVSLIQRHILESDKSHPELWGAILIKLQHTHPWLTNPLIPTTIDKSVTGSLVYFKGSLAVRVQDKLKFVGFAPIQPTDRFSYELLSENRRVVSDTVPPGIILKALNLPSEAYKLNGPNWITSLVRPVEDILTSSPLGEETISEAEEYLAPRVVPAFALLRPDSKYFDYEWKAIGLCYLSEIVVKSSRANPTYWKLQLDTTRNCGVTGYEVLDTILDAYGSNLVVPTYSSLEEIDSPEITAESTEVSTEPLANLFVSASSLAVTTVETQEEAPSCPSPCVFGFCSAEADLILSLPWTWGDAFRSACPTMSDWSLVDQWTVSLVYNYGYKNGKVPAEELEKLFNPACYGGQPAIGYFCNCSGKAFNYAGYLALVHFDPNVIPEEDIVYLDPFEIPEFGTLYFGAVDKSKFSTYSTQGKKGLLFNARLYYTTSGTIDCSAVSSTASVSTVPSVDFTTVFDKEWNPYLYLRRGQQLPTILKP